MRKIRKAKFKQFIEQANFLLEDEKYKFCIHNNEFITAQHQVLREQNDAKYSEFNYPQQVQKRVFRIVVFMMAGAIKRESCSSDF